MITNTEFWLTLTGVAGVTGAAAGWLVTAWYYGRREQDMADDYDTREQGCDIGMWDDDQAPELRSLPVRPDLSRAAAMPGPVQSIQVGALDAYWAQREANWQYERLFRPERERIYLAGDRPELDCADDTFIGHLRAAGLDADAVDRAFAS
jgi:hypothetical protein